MLTLRAIVLFVLVASWQSEMVTADSIIFNFEASRFGGPGVLTGQFGYDASIQPSIDPATAIYSGAAFLMGTIAGGPQDGGYVNLLNGDITLHYSLASGDLLDIRFGTVAGTTSRILIGDSSGLAFSSPDLPQVFDLNDFDSDRILVAVGGVDAGFPGGVESLYSFSSITSVPEPGSVTLLGTCLAFLCFTRRSRGLGLVQRFHQ